MSPNITIKGSTVALRALSFKDAPRFCRWLADPELRKFLDLQSGPPSLKQERQYIAEQKRKKQHVQFSIDTVEGVHIGSCSLMNISPQHKKAEFGIFIGDKKYWGQGCGTEACRLIVGYGFNKLKLHRIYLRYIAYNIRAAKAYQKVGFKTEGRLRDDVYRNGYFHDGIFMSILKSEFIPRPRSGHKHKGKKYGTRLRKN